MGRGCRVGHRRLRLQEPHLVRAARCACGSSYIRRFSACTAATVHALRSRPETHFAALPFHPCDNDMRRPAAVHIAAAGPRLRRTFAAIGAVELGVEHKLALVLAGACQTEQRRREGVERGTALMPLRGARA